MFQLVGQKQIADTETLFTFLSVFFLFHFSPSAIARRAILARELLFVYAEVGSPSRDHQ